MEDRIAKLMKDPRKGLITLAWPVIVSTLFSSLLNFIDFVFVGGLGPEALAGVQVSFPLFFLIIAIGSGISIGATSLIAKRLGEKNRKWAEETGLHALLLAGIVSVIFTSLVVFVIPLSSGLGGSPAVSAYAADYLGIIFAGVSIFFVLFTLQSILQGEGNTKTSMKLSIIYTVVNIILDPIFIYTFSLGVKGAAIATVLATAVALAVGLWYVVLSKKSYLKINPREFIYTPQIIKNILKVGIFAAMSQIMLSVAVLVVDWTLASFGDRPISAYGIGFRVDSLAILPMIGLAAGVIPMVGYFRGAKDFSGARRVSRLGIKLTFGYGALMAVLIFVFADVLSGMFSSDAEVVRIAAEYLRVTAPAYPFVGCVIVSSSAFQGLGRGMPSLVITMGRTVLLLIPLSLFLAYYAGLGVIGVWLGILGSILIVGSLAVLWLELQYKKLLEKRA